jgi:hypothetical protein
MIVTKMPHCTFVQIMNCALSLISLFVEIDYFACNIIV